jgi:CheY-like chemotaxis protein
VSDYLYLLLKFDNIAAKGVDSLDRIANREADDNDVKILTDITDLLGNLGCTSVISLIENTILAGKKGHTAFASDCAKKAQGDYERKQARILASKKEGKPDDGGRGSSRENFEALPLKDALEQLELVETTRKLRVLAVDDSPVMLSTINSVLGGEYKVYSMPKPSMVESFLRQITPDLILLDYEMPEINGFELVPIIRNFEEHKETPIIFITSMGTIEHISAATVLGARDFIVKPFQADNLLKKVAKHIVRKKIKTGGF